MPCVSAPIPTNSPSTTIFEVRIGLMADTHGFLDEAVFEYFAECDEVWHAGDFGPVDLLDRLQAFKPLRGVFGNIDGAEVRSVVPRDLDWECEGLRVYMTHIGGYPGAYERRVMPVVFRPLPPRYLAFPRCAREFPRDGPFLQTSQC